ncbi:hypothetical protein L873DRAFT_1825210 [Choiromyces venosus 120613-1]|uniref:Uncharacterized protein n=1 Tax=Choiromyces venosus 120613-1 TaxID=1336337 RepID=A0A3N4KI01_9PEZI|nr:hypothetical protein L873DRAFT_1825210 [Choiromyces venosus 120613-1]
MSNMGRIYPQTYFFRRGFEDLMDISPSSPEDPELVPILDREDNSDLSRPDSSISSYSSWSSTDSLCALGDSFPYIQTPQKYQLPPPPPPTPFLTSPLVSPSRHGLGDDRDLYSSPFVLSTSLLELGGTLGDLFVESDREYRDMGESTYIPFQHKQKHLSESWSLPCSFNEPTNYPALNFKAYDNEDYCIPVRSSFDEGIFVARKAPSVCPTNRTNNPAPHTPPPSRCSGESEERPWSLSEIEKQLQILADEPARAEESQEQDEIAELERPTRRLHRGGAMKKFSRAWKGYLHRS